MQRTDSDRQRRQDLADIPSGRHVRLLPWTTDGKRCLLSTDNAGGYLSRLADEIAREVTEETGLANFRPGRLLLVDYIPRNEETGVTEGYNLVFDGGTLLNTAAVTLPEPEDGNEPELTAYRWVQPHTLNTFTEPYQESRVRRALAVLDGFGPAQYL